MRRSGGFVATAVTTTVALLFAAPSALAVDAAADPGASSADTTAATPIAPADQPTDPIGPTTATDPTAPDPANAPPPPDAVTVLTETAGGGLRVQEVPAVDPAAKALKLSARPNVIAASPVQTRTILSAPSSDGSARDLQWPLNHLGAEDAWKTSTGTGVNVAVIDTGVDSSHPDLAGRIVPGYDAIRNRSNSGDTDPHGHGTHVAGIVVAHGAASGIAPNARVMPVRVMDSQGYGTTTDIINGIIWATNHGANVINMSLGSPAPDKSEQAALKWARAKGVMIVAAAGNDGSTAPLFPAAYGDYSTNSATASDPVIGVGAIDESSSRAFFSQRGNPVDVAAPGMRIFSTYPRAKGSYAWESGTSMASPYVAGVVALALSYAKSEHPDWSDEAAANAVDNAVRGSTKDLGTLGNDSLFGRGEVTASGTLARLGAPAWSGMPTRLSMTGQRRGRATLSLNAPAGSTFAARITSAAGSGGATASASPSSGTLVWSGTGTGRLVSKTLSGLSRNRSYAVTVFVTKGSETSRAVTGLRPIRWSLSHPRTILVGARKRLTIGTRLPRYGIVPSGQITVDYRWNGHHKKLRVTPLGSELSSMPIPQSNASISFKASITGGYGFWPSASTLHKVAYHW